MKNWPEQIQVYAQQMVHPDNAVKLEVLQSLHGLIGTCLVAWEQEVVNDNAAHRYIKEIQCTIDTISACPSHENTFLCGNGWLKRDDAIEFWKFELKKLGVISEQEKT